MFLSRFFSRLKIFEIPQRGSIVLCSHENPVGCRLSDCRTTGSFPRGLGELQKHTAVLVPASTLHFLPEAPRQFLLLFHFYTPGCTNPLVLVLGYSYRPLPPGHKMPGTAAPLGFAAQPARLHVAQRTLRQPRICALAERPRSAGKARSASRVAGKLRSDRESAWGDELLPGTEAPSLQFDNITASALPEHAAPREQPRNALVERITGPWDRLESRYVPWPGRAFLRK